MKHLKRFESKYVEKYDIQEVLDILKDFADEFGAKYVEYEDLRDPTLMGLFYYQVALFGEYSIGIEYRYDRQSTKDRDDAISHLRKIKEYLDEVILPRFKSMGIECYTKNIQISGHKLYAGIILKR